jgi:cobaltochelatase CobN
MTKKRILLFAIALVLLFAVWGVWSRFAAPTRVALLNFQAFQTTSIIQSNTSRWVRYREVSPEDAHKLGRFDLVLGFGMGMQLTAEQREQIRRAADRGTPVYILAATNPDNDICNLDSVQRQAVGDYLNSGNKKNYQSLARYIRQSIDRKTWFVSPPDSVSVSETDVLFHLDETQAFKEVSAYENYLRENRYYTQDGPKIAIVGGLNDPFSGNRDNIDSLIVSLQRAGMNVYPVASFMKRLDFLREIKPDAVVYFAHGRMAMGQNDAAVDWLRERNVPIFAPLSLLQTQEEWEADPLGMFGGFFSQSIVMPELDGAIYPYVLNAQVIDKNGLYLFKAIPERLKNFTEIVSNFVSLKRKRNADKKLAIYYFKGAGQSTLTAQGLETVPALYNFLLRLKAEGYRVDNLPSDVKKFEQLLMAQGAVLSPYAEGVFDDFLKNGQPALVEKGEYEAWAGNAFPQEMYKEVVDVYGDAPGSYMAVRRDGREYLAVARVQMGNIVLLPQPMAGLGGDAFAIVHGAKSAPPHTYIASYLWSRYAFGADAMLHFGTHGSLEFTPQKQVALSDRDWPDRLVGPTPHFYYYTIGNIGESMMAKRRSYASIASYLTPAFMETEMRSQFKTLQGRIQRFYKAEDAEQLKASLEVKKLALQMGLHRDLRLDSVLANPYSYEEIERIENFAEEIANEKMTGHLYTSGIPYSPEKIRSTVMAMSADPIAYSLANLDRLSGQITSQQLKNRSFFTRQYLEPAQSLVARILNGLPVGDELVRSVARLSASDLAEAKAILAPPRRMMPPMAAPEAKGESNTKDSGKASGETKAAPPSGGHPAWIPKIGSRPASTRTAPATPQTVAQAGGPVRPGASMQTGYSPEQKARARAITEIERTLRNVTAYQKALQESPEQEFKALLNALGGGYIAPSSGGDAVANPAAVPTGRNLYAINAEATPSEIAWEKGVTLAQATLEQYKAQHGDYPRKVSYTFWSSEFIESEGATIAQVLYMLGVEPVRDAFGRVSDLQLIASKELGRPRVDVVVQTSGQFRDLAASRLMLIHRAVEMAAAAGDEAFDNRVSAGTTEIERLLVEQGISPKEAREMSSQRIFGGINGMYGTGIQGMVTSGDRWESEQEIADVYLHNMGAAYGDEKDWGRYREGLLRAALHNTDAVVQPRQSNTWGALSLDHVYEFMGGLNLAVRNVTGKDPEAYFADYRNRNNVRIQELKEAIGVEARSTVFNPAYIRQVMAGNASSAAQITEVVTNTYGWNVMKPAAIDNEMWDKFHSVYVRDEYRLGAEAFFRRENPHALQELTAVMLETARKGLWKASDIQLNELAQLHTQLVRDFGSAASGFSAGNVALQDFIAHRLDAAAATEYRTQLQRMRTASPAADNAASGVVMKKDAMNGATDASTNALNGLWITAVVLIAFVALLLLLRKRKK